MAQLISFYVDFKKIDKSKLKEGKGYFTISVNDETDNYGNNAAMFHQQSKEEREAKAQRTYVGNGKVVWTNGNSVVAEKQEETKKPVAEAKTEDLPF
jgi:hypothetical protein